MLLKLTQTLEKLKKHFFFNVRTSRKSWNRGHYDFSFNLISHIVVNCYVAEFLLWLKVLLHIWSNGYMIQTLWYPWQSSEGQRSIGNSLWEGYVRVLWAKRSVNSSSLLSSVFLPLHCLQYCTYTMYLLTSGQKYSGKRWARNPDWPSQSSGDDVGFPSECFNMFYNL